MNVRRFICRRWNRLFGGGQSHVGSSKYHHLDSCTQALPVGSWIARVSLANKACVTLPGTLFIIKEKGEKEGRLS